jgi:hypothetical protein
MGKLNCNLKTQLQLVSNIPDTFTMQSAKIREFCGRNVFLNSKTKKVQTQHRDFSLEFELALTNCFRNRIAKNTSFGYKTNLTDRNFR